MREIYCIRVQGLLDDRWSDWFSGLTIDRQCDGTTVLIGEIVDQAALHGVIERIRDLGLPLISVRQESKAVNPVSGGDICGVNRS